LRRYLTLFALSTLTLNAFGQDTSVFLNQVEVKAFDFNTSISKSPVPIAIIDSTTLNLFESSSILEGLNLVSGVKMESRGAGGSRRISIRGSSLRSPFGVRNIKVYYNDLPFSEADNSTALELIDAGDINSIEVIKGPQGSFYGAGLGGTMLVSSGQIVGVKSPFLVNFSSTIGSYGYLREHVGLSKSWNKIGFSLNFTDQKLTGYRAQEGNSKEQFNAHLALKPLKNHTLSFHSIYFDGHWELPGSIDSITAATSPRESNQYSIDHNAAVYRKWFKNGAVLKGDLSPKLNYSLAFTKTNSTKLNPYGTSRFFQGLKDETLDGYATRSVLNYTTNAQSKTLNLSVGYETANDNENFEEYVNDFGKKGALKIDEKTTNSQRFVFSSLKIRDENLLVEIGLSLNSYDLELLNQLDTNGNPKQEIYNSTNVLLPHFAISYKFKHQVYAFGTVAKGISLPTLFELRTFNGGLNNSLVPENGINYELGVRKKIGKNTLIQLSGYQNDIDNAIIFANDDVGIPTYSNAGNVVFKGIELSVSGFEKINSQIVNGFSYQLTSAVQDYHFVDYVETNENSGQQTALDGNKVPGVSNNTLSAALGLINPTGLTISSGVYYYGKQALTNNNSHFADAYTLVNVSVGYSQKLLKNKMTLNAKVGVNNLFNTNYSSFYQLNAVRDKYYNPSAEINYFGNLGLSYNF
jgi:iron complex outermembrane receptor protein